MKKHILLALLTVSLTLTAQTKATIDLYPSQAHSVISRHIYGQFAEHLGACIYGGLWVGETSTIPNIKGYRTDVVNALKALQIPNLRWPGGCFADAYHWQDGIGSKDSRPHMTNTNWGGTVEDNSFGTHEFLNLCELLNCEPYISANVGSGTVREMAEWIEYITSNDDTPMANLRRKNGRNEAWKVHFWGIGNESWGCGGEMTAQYYSDIYRQYSTYCRNFSGNTLFKIASGASDYDLNWTETLMKNIDHRMQGISLHFYSVIDWSNKGSSTQFTDDDYYRTLAKSLEMDTILKQQTAVMDKYDRDKKTALMVDEWGTWWEAEPGTNPGHLFQQNTMRDAMVAALTLNIFQQYTDRVKMSNIAQVANVLQSMVLTRNEQMVLTPTYHVYEMYKVHQEGLHIPLKLVCKEHRTPNGQSIPTISASASRNANGVISLSLINIDLNASQTIELSFEDLQLTTVTGRILTANSITAHNTFESPEQVTPQPFKGAKLHKGQLSVTLPSKSIVVLELK